MACTHDNAHYTIGTEVGCFDCWLTARNAKRQALRDNLARLLAGGVTLLETKDAVSPWDTDWSIDTFTGHWRTHHHGSGGGGSFAAPARYKDVAVAADAREQGAARLAAHLENRHTSFGTTLQAYCMTCGEELVALPEDGDPTCAGCHEKLAVFAAEVDAEIKAEGGR